MFSQSLREVLGPVINQRYLVSRSEDDIKLGFYTPIWWTFRKLFRFVKQERVAYHQFLQHINKKQKSLQQIGNIMLVEETLFTLDQMKVPSFF
jgi:hypothetical protein